MFAIRKLPMLISDVVTLGNAGIGQALRNAKDAGHRQITNGNRDKEERSIWQGLI